MQWRPNGVIDMFGFNAVKYPSIEGLREEAKRRADAHLPVTMQCAFCRHSVAFLDDAEMNRFVKSSCIPKEPLNTWRMVDGKVTCPVCYNAHEANREIKQLKHRRHL